MFMLKEQNHVFAHAQEFDFRTGGRECKDPRISTELSQIRLHRPQSTLSRLSVLISMPFDGASRRGKRYGAGQGHLSPAAFRKVKKIGKRLKSNRTSNKAGFCKEIDSRDLDRTGRIALV